MNPSPLLVKHLSLICPNNFKVFDAFTKEELNIKEHLEDRLMIVNSSKDTNEDIKLEAYVKNINDEKLSLSCGNHSIDLSGNTYHSIENHCYYKVVELCTFNGIWVTLKSNDGVRTRKIRFDYLEDLIKNGTMQLVK